MKIKFILALFVLSFASCTAQENQENTFQNGADLLLRNYRHLVEDKKIALVVNYSSVLNDGTHLVNHLLKNNFNVVKILTPEHGYRIDKPAGVGIKDEIDPATGIPVYSLYGKNKKPTKDILYDTDVIIYDIQDIGIRYYTYISTLFYVIQSAAEFGKPVVILDRANPLSGSVIEGPVLQRKFSSFVGIAPIPVRYGLTPGELAGYFVGENLLGIEETPEISVVKLEGWDRTKFFDNYNNHWIKPSPNIPDINTAIVYAGTCLIEGTNVSEGRGTEKPFKIIGAPWVNSEELIQRIGMIDGAELHPVTFTPVEIEGVVSNPKFNGAVCFGIEIEITDREKFRPVNFGLKLITALVNLYPEKFRFNSMFFDNLAGNDVIRERILKGVNTGEIIKSFDSETELYLKRVKKYFLY